MALREERYGPGQLHAGWLGQIAGAAAIANSAGARDSAIAWLGEEAMVSLGLRGARLAVDPLYANLRDDARFRALATETRP